MPGALVILFWCWVAVSLVIVIRRAIRKVAGSSRAPSTAAPSAVAPSAPASTPVPTPRPEPDTAPRPQAQTAPSLRDPLPASAPEPSAAVTIADALRGIRMPCELMPLNGSTVDFERRAAFVTVGYTPDAVAPRVADEIERIGLAVKSLSDDTAVAERDDVRVKIAVRSIGPTIGGVGDPVYPTAPENSVVVEFELV